MSAHGECWHLVQKWLILPFLAVGSTEIVENSIAVVTGEGGGSLLCSHTSIMPPLRRKFKIKSKPLNEA